MEAPAWLVMVRPANVVTALTDVLAGAAIVGGLATFACHHLYPSLPLLLLSTAGLYAGGIVFNDLFDLEIDRLERPERILPSGRMTRAAALRLGVLLLITGVVAAFLASAFSGFVALLIVALVLLYDAKAKSHIWWGPVVMGACRGSNLLLGMTFLGVVAWSNLYLLALVPLVFVAAITLTSRSENTANNQADLYLALGLDLLVAGIIVILVVVGIMQVTVLPFLALWLGMNLLAKRKALHINRPEHVRHAVRTGVLSLIPLNACYAAGFGHIGWALVVLLLLPCSLFLARQFAVT